jgi:hypothetical protein
MKLFKTLAYFGGMISAVFVISLINQRIQAPSVLWTLYSGTVIILIRATMDIFFTSIHFEKFLFEWFAQSSFLDFAVFIFLVSIFFLFFFDRIIRSYKYNIRKSQVLKLETRR